MKTVSLFLLFSIILLSACSNKPQKSEKETLSVTIEPQKYFLEQIVGDKYNVNCVIPAGVNPESFDASPSQIMSLNSSSAFFKTGLLPIEDQLTRDTKIQKIIDCSEGLSLSEHDHEHGENCTHDHGGHDGADPHIWSSLIGAKTIINNMYQSILQIDSVNSDYYTHNYQNLMKQMNETDSIIRSYISQAPSKSFVIYHPALSYYADEYGLKQYSIENEGKNPSPAQLKQLIDNAKKDNVQVVFIQQEFDTKNAETVAKDINAKTVSINLMSYDWYGEMINIAKVLAQKSN